MSSYDYSPSYYTGSPPTYNYPSPVSQPSPPQIPNQYPYPPQQYQYQPRTTQPPSPPWETSPPPGPSPGQRADIKYFCLHDPCGRHGTYFARKADLERHTSITHNRDIHPLHDCTVSSCHRKGTLGFTRKDKLVDHLRDVHKMQIPKRGSSSSS